MDSQFEDLCQTLYGSSFSSSDQIPFYGLRLQGLSLESNLATPSPGRYLHESLLYSGGTTEVDHREDDQFSDLIINRIYQVLMEDDEEEEIRAFQASPYLEATEKSLYEAIGKEYPPRIQGLVSPPRLPFNSPNGTEASDFLTSSILTKPILVKDSPAPSKSSSQSSSGSSDRPYSPAGVSRNRSLSRSNSSSRSSTAVAEQHKSSSSSSYNVSDTLNNTVSMVQFNQESELAKKFLSDSCLDIGLENSSFPNKTAQATSNVPPHGLFRVGLGSNELPHLKPEVRDKDMRLKLENHSENIYMVLNSRGKKQWRPEDFRLSEQSRASKQSAVSEESVIRSEMFDRVLLCTEGAGEEAALRKALREGLSINSDQTSVPKGSNGSGRKGRGRKSSGQDVVDLRSLLTLCAQSVAASDHRAAYDLLKKIRQHSSPKGDGYQRMAHYFAEGLEARLAGVGTPTHTFLINGSASAAYLLRAYQLFLVACPFRKMSNFAANRTIMNAIAKATRVHIVDFGIAFGFQWPCLMQRLSKRIGGPPVLRITGIDLPMPGFRPAKRIEETGCRLTNYAESFNVPFEFNAIAKKWETIVKEDIKIKENEVLIVNCMYRFKCLLDETVMVESPRNIVLKLIHDLKPDVFIHGTVNGSFSAPFFLTRFREALFHFYTLFDMLEATAPRNLVERTLVERELYGRQAMNVIACEGAERIERPETYKQWQVRNERIGFKQLPLDREIVEMVKERVKCCYHKDFLISEDGKWLLQGWKGRIVYAISCWKPESEQFIT